MAPPDYAPVVPRLAALAESDPAREVCGFVLEGEDGALEVVAVRNVVDDPAWSPEGPEDPARAYLADPAAQLRLGRSLRRSGGRIAAVYHSHVDGEATLSPRDVAEALLDGAPIQPGVDQIVVGTRHGEAVEIRVFRWSVAGFLPVASHGAG